VKKATLAAVGSSTTVGRKKRCDRKTDPYRAARASSHAEELKASSGHSPTSGKPKEPGGAPAGTARREATALAARQAAAHTATTAGRETHHPEGVHTDDQVGRERHMAATTPVGGRRCR